jgi:invasion protein IalB
MTLRHALIAGLAAATLLMVPASVMAQSSGSQSAGAANAPAPAPAPASATDASANAGAAASSPPSQNWLKVCDPLPDGKKACVMRQVVLNQGQFLGSFLLRDDPGQQSRLLAVAAVPLGVLLPFGLTWQIDNGKPIRVPYMLCDPQSCASQLVINEAYVNSLKKGSKLTLTAKTRQNKDLQIVVNLAGFTTTYDSDTALTFDQYRNQQTGTNALEKALQGQAEQLRLQKEKQGTQGAPAPSGN